MATSTDIRHVYHEDGTEDTRYSVALEFTGHSDRWYAARFQGHWVGEATTEERAWDIARRFAKGEG
jgi:hypothetical protein